MPYDFESSWTNSVSSSAFVDPFGDAASRSMPESMPLALRWSEYLLHYQGLYRQAIRRVLSYFITEIVVEGDVGDDEKEKIKRYLEDEQGIYLLLREVGEAFLTYNNVFLSVIQKFDRSLRCPKCGHEAPFRRVSSDRKYRFRWDGQTFNASCPSCRFRGDWGRPVDRKADKVYVKSWNPHDISIVGDPEFSGDREYEWRIPAEYRRRITHAGGYGDVDRRGLFELERADWDVLQAVRKNQNFRFDPETIFHLSVKPLPGIRSGGWGVPDPLINFRHSWRTAVLERYNEAICQDYIVPFRVLTPSAKGPGEVQDPLLNFPMGSFVARVQNMLRRRKIDPNAWFVLPFGLEYKALGGDARQLAPKDLLDQAYEALLNAAGVPVDLYKGSLQVQSAPAALRLFEAHWAHLVRAFNQFLDFLARRLSRLLSWERVRLRLKPVTIVDDIQKASEKLQLGVGGTISQSSSLEAVGLRFREEARKKMEEEKFMAELQEEFQKEQEGKSLAQMMSAPPQPPGAAPGQPGAPADPTQQGAAQGQATPAGTPAQIGIQTALNSPMGMSGKYSPQDMMAYAEQEAGKMLALPEGQRQTAMRALKQQNETVWALTKAQVDKARQQARNIGGAQVIQQQYGGS